jgi:hypothetical protein
MGAVLNTGQLATTTKWRKEDDASHQDGLAKLEDEGVASCL